MKNNFVMLKFYSGYGDVIIIDPTHAGPTTTRESNLVIPVPSTEAPSPDDDIKLDKPSSLLFFSW